VIHSSTFCLSPLLFCESSSKVSGRTAPSKCRCNSTLGNRAMKDETEGSNSGMGIIYFGFWIGDFRLKKEIAKVSPQSKI
jgi:hypothetical protein